MDAPAGSHAQASRVDAARLFAAASGNEHAGHHDAASHFDACSYCGLLAHNLPIAQDVALNVSIVERVTRVAVVTPVAKSFNAASPRAPPVGFLKSFPSGSRIELCVAPECAPRVPSLVSSFRNPRCSRSFPERDGVRAIAPWRALAPACRFP